MGRYLEAAELRRMLLGTYQVVDAAELACSGSWCILCILYPCTRVFFLIDSRKYLSESFARTRYHRAVAREFLGPRNGLYHLAPAPTIPINVNRTEGTKHTSLFVVQIIPVYRPRTPVSADEALTSFTYPYKHVVVLQRRIIRASDTHVCVYY